MPGALRGRILWVDQFTARMSPPIANGGRCYEAPVEDEPEPVAGAAGVARVCRRRGMASGGSTAGGNRAGAAIALGCRARRLARTARAAHSADRRRDGGGPCPAGRSGTPSCPDRAGNPPATTADGSGSPGPAGLFCGREPGPDGHHGSGQGGRVGQAAAVRSQRRRGTGIRRTGSERSLEAQTTQAARAQGHRHHARAAGMHRRLHALPS